MYDLNGTSYPLSEELNELICILCQQQPCTFTDIQEFVHNHFLSPCQPETICKNKTKCKKVVTYINAFYFPPYTSGNLFVSSRNLIELNREQPDGRKVWDQMFQKHLDSLVKSGHLVFDDANKTYSAIQSSTGFFSKLLDAPIIKIS